MEQDWAFASEWNKDHNIINNPFQEFSFCDQNKKESQMDMDTCKTLSFSNKTTEERSMLCCWVIIL
jgi:hypothetical protein